MAAPRLTLLYPIFYRGPIVTECGPLRTSVRQRPRRKSIAGFATSSKHRDEVRQEQYKPANTPPPQAINKKQPPHIGAAISSQQQASKEEREKPREGRSADSDRPVRESESTTEKGAPPDAPELPPPKEQETIMSPDPEQSPPAVPPHNSLDTVLSMPSPAEETADEKPPHLQPPPYIHHFDTWSLVQDLDKGGFAQKQSIMLMKAVRSILADNMDLARRGLVSKSNVENETYLFRAACSELRTEIQNNRKAETEKLRTQRAQLQHELDILNQRMTQESSNMKDELKGMFDDRKMAVRMQQRAMESKVRLYISQLNEPRVANMVLQIQELNYKITIALNSDAKTEVEGVRWVLTRRAAAALGISVVMILAALNYSRYVERAQEKDRAKFADMRDTGVQTVGQDDSKGDETLASEGVS